MSAGEAEWITETAVARLLNVPRSVLRAERPVLASRISETGAVLWRKDAVESLALRLGLPLAFPVEKSAPPDEPESLAVYSRCPNPNIIMATRANGERVAVRVVSNLKYQRLLTTGEPMMLQAKPSTAGSWWVLTSREPRWPGKF